MELRHGLQQSIGKDKGSGTSASTCLHVQDVEYCLTKDGLIIFRDMIYVRDNNELKKVILREFQVKPYLGHPGYQKILIALKNFYYWPNLKRDVAEFVAICFYCQCVKAECKHLGGLLQPIVIPEWKWEVISMEFIIGLSRTVRQHDSIMVVVDKLTKVAHFISVNSTFSSSDVAQVFIRDVVRIHGVSKNIVSNRDAKFTSKFWKDLFASLGTEFAFSTTYHPQTDRQVERVNRILEDMLRMYVLHQK